MSKQVTISMNDKISTHIPPTSVPLDDYEKELIVRCIEYTGNRGGIPREFYDVAGNIIKKLK